MTIFAESRICGVNCKCRIAGALVLGIMAAMLAAMLAAAAAEPPEMCRVYVYDMSPAVRMNPVWVDGVRTAQLKRNRYFGLNLPAGEHSFSGRRFAEQITLDLVPGKTYYLRLDQVISYPTGYEKLTRQRAEDAAPVINTLGAIESKDIFDTAHVTLERP